MIMHDLVPGRGYGQLLLGAKLRNVLLHLRSNLSAFGSDVAVAWDEESPQIGNIIVTVSALSRDGVSQPSLRLVFAGPIQRLLLIEVVGDPCLRRATWKGERLLPSPSSSSSPPKQTAFKLLNARFGPTYPPSPHTPDIEQILSYPGIVFAYPVEQSVVAGSSGGSGENAQRLLSRIIISQHDPSAPKAVAFPDIALLEKNMRIDNQDLSPLTYLEIHLASETQPTRVTMRHRSVANDKRRAGISEPEVAFTIGVTTTEDISADLGSATQTFYKTTDPALHDTGTPDYFLNYFAEGLDFLMHGPTHTLRKIIVHGNSPGEIQFGTYARCQWAIVKEGKKAVTSEDTLSIVREALGGKATVSGNVASERAILLDRTADAYAGVRLDRTTELHTIGPAVFEITQDSSVETLWLT